MIERVLVANRGEVARRVFRTCERLGIATAAVYSSPDADALFVREADVAVALGGAAPADSYLRGDAIVAAALQVGADAIHPGYGFLAENAAFAQAVLDAGLTWIGPAPAVIAAMGSKTEARVRMQAAGVPVLPSGDDIGFPVMVKAVAGGGGRGMRIVREASELAAAVEAAGREALSAFGDGTVFLERYLAGARHVEIQILGDAHGNVAVLHERDCSVQRRHQKVIEEAPSPAVDAALRAALGEAAGAAARALGYVGAGTVEFLLSGREFFFLEVNTRLQVEHPVTEAVTGLDLVELQLLVAEGLPLPREALEPALDGHAIEARLYAEDVAAGFLPVTGTLERFAFGDGVRVDAGVEDGSEIGPHYDPMLAKVVAHGRTREDAVRRLAGALARAELHGLVTNRDFLVQVLRHPEFVGGTADTGFLDRVSLDAPLLADRRLPAAAVALAGAAARRRDARGLPALPSGFRNNRSALQRVAFEGVTIEYALHPALELRIDGDAVDAVLHECTPDVVDLSVGGVRRRYRVRGGWINCDEGQAFLRELPRFPQAETAGPAGSLLSPMPGAVVRVLAAAGDSVVAGEPLLVLEAMKMEHEIVAPASGTLTELRASVGLQVPAGAVLAIIEA